MYIFLHNVVYENKHIYICLSVILYSPKFLLRNVDQTLSYKKITVSISNLKFEDHLSAFSS